MKPEQLQVIIERCHIQDGEPMRAIARRLGIDYGRVFRAKANLNKDPSQDTVSHASLTEWSQVWRTGWKGGRTHYHSKSKCQALTQSEPIPCNLGAMTAAGRKPCPYCFKP